MQPTVYPVPLFVRNTFIEAHTGRPASFDEFFQERTVMSCPASRVSEPGSDCDPWAAPPATAKRVPYSPGEQLVRSAAFGSPSPLAMLPTAGTVGDKAPSGPGDQDGRSECSTVDTMPRAPPSPAPSPARPAVAPGSPGAVPEAGRAVPVLRLEEAIGEAGATAAELPSEGSAGHLLGQCKPCAFVHTKGCASGSTCKFCHLCEPGEKQRRQKEKRAFFGAMRQLQKIASESWPFGSQQPAQLPLPPQLEKPRQ